LIQFNIGPSDISAVWVSKPQSYIPTKSRNKMLFLWLSTCAMRSWDWGTSLALTEARAFLVVIMLLAEMRCFDQQGVIQMHHSGAGDGV
jgi:hypothetical protein